jgi:hypothetical protein
MLEPRLGTFLRRPPPSRPARPLELDQLDQLVGAALAGPGPSRARLAERLAALGRPVPPGPTSQQLVEAIAELDAQVGPSGPARVGATQVSPPAGPR